MVVCVFNEIITMERVSFLPGFPKESIGSEPGKAGTDQSEQRMETEIKSADLIENYR